MSLLLSHQRHFRRYAPIFLAAGFTGASLSCKDVTAPVAPEVPTGVAVVLLSPTSVKVTWTANSDASSVRSYNVLRNGTKVGEVTAPSLIDTGLSDLVSYKYAVSANGTSGLVSAASADTPGASITLPDATPPTVASTSPAAGATGVDRAAKISAIFSEPLDPATAIAANFLVKVTGGADIAGTVTYTASTRTIEFTPAASLPGATAISATITTGIRDAAGNAMASAFVLAFTTRDDIPPTVTSTTIPASGDVPVTQVIAVTMSEPIDASSLSSTNVRLTPGASGAAVPGTISYDAPSRVVTFTPTGGLTSATDYVFTIGTGIKDIAGNASTTSFTRSFRTADVTPPSVVSVSPADLAPSVAVSATVSVVFSKAMDASTITTSSVTLRLTSSGAFVSGSVSYDAASRTVTFLPSSALLPGTGYTVAVSNTVRGANGVALAQSFTSTFSTAGVVPPPDTTPPSVVSSVPSVGAQGVAITTLVRLTFSEAMSPSTVNSTTVILTVPGSATVAGTVSYDNSIPAATFTPAVALLNGTTYTLTATTGLKDVAGNSLAAQYTAAFATVATTPPPDTTPPTVISSVPANGTTGVAVTTPIRVTFSEDVIASTVNASTFTLSLGGTAISGSVSYDAASRTATFAPQGGLLAENQAYTATIATGVMDLAGNALASNFVFSFSTAGTVTAPTIVSRSPSPGSTGVVPSTMVRIGFNTAMDPTTISGSTIQLSLNGAPVAATVTYDAGTRVATLTPSAVLANNQTYVVSVSTGVRDASGNALASTDSFSFTTEAGAATFDISGVRVPKEGWWQATTAGSVGIHFHVVFDQSGPTLSLWSQCPAGLNDSCITYAQNQAGTDAIGMPSLGYVWVLLMSVSGTINGAQVSFTFTNANGKSFTFAGVVNSQYLMTGTISGATLPAEQVTFTRLAP